MCLCAVCAALLAGCGQSAREPQRTPPIEEAVGEMARTMDKAQEVQDVAMQHKRALDEALRESEGDDRR
jgi:hypothetical protein